jgi:hypothetical protein
MMIDGDGRNVVIFSLANAVKYAFLNTPYDLTTNTGWNSLAINCAGGGCITKCGDKLFTASAGAGTQTLYQYNLTDEWNPGSAGLETSLDISSIITTTGQPDGVQINGDGTRLYVLEGNVDGTIHTWVMATPYELSTASYAGSDQFSHSMGSPCNMYYDQYSDVGTLSIWDGTDQDLYVHSRVGG